MNSKKEMKQFRNQIRKFMRNVNKDFAETPSMKFLCDRIEVRFVKWDVKEHSVLVYAYDKMADPTTYTNKLNQWKWIWTGSQFRMNDIWRMVNDIACEIQHPNFR